MPWDCHSIVSLVILSAAAVVKPDSWCGRAYFGTDSDGGGLSGIIQSYNYPFDYRDNQDCDYVIELFQPPTGGPFSYEICFEFHRFQLEACDVQLDRLYDYLTFTEDDGTRRDYCGGGEVYEPAPEPYEHVWGENFCWTTTRLEFIINFQSDQSSVYRGYYARFRVKGPNDTKKHSPATSDRTAPCFEEKDWTCFNRKCVLRNESVDILCNGVDDCGDASDDSYTHARCTSGLELPGLKACDFEDHYNNLNKYSHGCGYMEEVTGWRMDVSSTDERRGPQMDHTKYHGEYMGGGFYIRTYFTSLPQADPVYLHHPSDHLMDHTESCLSFWYHMKGHDAGTLSVYLQRDVYTGLPVWSRDGSFGDRWLHAEIYFSDTDLSVKDGVVFEGKPGSDWNTQIAIDDISVSEGPCMGEDVSCTFESGYCNWDNSGDANDAYRWMRWTTVDDERTHLTIQKQDSGIYDTAVVVSPVITITPNGLPSCFTFWYLCDGMGSITVYTSSLSGDRTQIASIDTAQCQDAEGWTRKIVDIQPPLGTYQIVIVGRIRLEPVILSLDHLAVFQGSCSEISLGSCQPYQFRCNDGTCIAIEQQCDGRTQCPDGSDESEWACKGCPIGNCAPNQFCCRQGTCIEDYRACNAINDCNDWFDEDNCEDQCDEFLCASGRCVFSGARCNGVSDCPDGSDEHGCSSGDFPTAAIIGIAISVVAVVFLILAKGASWYYKRRNRGGTTCRFPCRRDSDSSDEPDVVDDPAAFQPPPDYHQAVDNPLYMPQNRISSDDGDDKSLPPSYNTVVRGTFLQTTVPNEQEIKRLREQMLAGQNAAAAATAAATNSVASSSSTVTVDLDSRRLPPPTYRDSWDRRPSRPPAYDNDAYDGTDVYMLPRNPSWAPVGTSAGDEYDISAARHSAPPGGAYSNPAYDGSREQGEDSSTPDEHGDSDRGREAENVPSSVISDGAYDNAGYESINDLHLQEPMDGNDSDLQCGGPGPVMPEGKPPSPLSLRGEITLDPAALSTRYASDPDIRVNVNSAATLRRRISPVDDVAGRHSFPAESEV